MERFDSATAFISERLKKALLAVDPAVKERTTEIRLRSEKAVVLSVSGKSIMLSSDSKLTASPENALICKKEELLDSFNRLCEFSAHSFQNSISSGFITTRGGHRVGLTGTAVCSADGSVTTIRDVSSLNVRVAREVKGCADDIIKRLRLNNFGGLIIAGPPSSGKTTVLRDLIRRLSGFESPECLKVCAIDERGELAAMKNGVAQNDVGINIDVLTGYPKSCAILTAVKTMSPQVIACDEVAAESELEAIAQGANSGITFIVTVHASGFDELIRRRQVERLIDIGCFETVVMLKGGSLPGKIENVYEVGEIKDEIYRRRFGLACRGGLRDGAC